MATITLRPVADGDLPSFFEFGRQPAARWMSAFTASDPDDRVAFDAQWARIRADRSVVIRTVEQDGVVVGSVLAYDTGKIPCLAYLIDPQRWGQGLATAAVGAFLEAFWRRPVRAWVAADNAGAIRVLQKHNFRRIDEARSFAAARGEEITEYLYELVMFPHLVTE